MLQQLRRGTHQLQNDALLDQYITAVDDAVWRAERCDIAIVIIEQERQGIGGITQAITIGVD